MIKDLKKLYEEESEGNAYEYAMNDVLDKAVRYGMRRMFKDVYGIDLDNSDCAMNRYVMKYASDPEDEWELAEKLACTPFYRP